MSNFWHFFRTLISSCDKYTWGHTHVCTLFVQDLKQRPHLLQAAKSGLSKFNLILVVGNMQILDELKKSVSTPKAPPSQGTKPNFDDGENISFFALAPLH
jgi:hypothetical protein